MTTKTSLTELKQALAEKTKTELIEEITQLYKKFPVVKEYYQAALSSNDTAVLDKYKEIVNAEFLMRGNRFPKMRLSVAKKAISDFKKVSQSKHSIADIMLTYVEAGVQCTAEFGDIDEDFYYSMESMYETALKYVVKENLFAEFDARLEEIVDNACAGWGFQGQLSKVYEMYQPAMPESQTF